MDCIQCRLLILRMPEEEEETWGEYPVFGVFYLFIWRELFGAFEFVMGLERSPGWGGLQEHPELMIWVRDMGRGQE